MSTGLETQVTVEIRKLSENFEYSSDQNGEYLTISEIKKIIKSQN